jgi:hypothetical protein
VAFFRTGEIVTAYVQITLPPKGSNHRHPIFAAAHRALLFALDRNKFFFFFLNQAGALARQKQVPFLVSVPRDDAWGRSLQLPLSLRTWNGMGQAAI